MFDIERVYQPGSLAEALQMAAQHPQAKIVAGGTDVLIEARAGKLAGRELLSIHGLAALSEISLDEGGDLLIGPLCTFREAERQPLILRHIPILATAAGSVGGPQIRAQGTLGGNLCNGVTSADTASTMHALQAELKLESVAGSRVIPIKEFYVGPGQTARAEGEILTKIIIKRANYENSGGCYLKYAMREAMDIATLGCAVLVQPDAAGRRIERLRIAFGVAAPVPMRAEAAEEALSGLTPEQAAEQIAALVRAEIKPRDSWRASKEFRLHIAGVLAGRALAAAWGQAMERRRA